MKTRMGLKVDPRAHLLDLPHAKPGRRGAIATLVSDRRLLRLPVARQHGQDLPQLRTLVAALAQLREAFTVWQPL